LNETVHEDFQQAELLTALLASESFWKASLAKGC
jgi:hypothetical protein